MILIATPCEMNPRLKDFHANFLDFDIKCYRLENGFELHRFFNADGDAMFAIFDDKTAMLAFDPIKFEEKHITLLKEKGILQ